MPYYQTTLVVGTGNYASTRPYVRTATSHSTDRIHSVVASLPLLTTTGPPSTRLSTLTRRPSTPGLLPSPAAAFTLTRGPQPPRPPCAQLNIHTLRIPHTSPIIRSNSDGNTPIYRPSPLGRQLTFDSPLAVTNSPILSTVAHIRPPATPSALSWTVCRIPRKRLRHTPNSRWRCDQSTSPPVR